MILAVRQSPPGMPRPITGMRMSLTSDCTTRPMAAPMITPTASASAFCLKRKSRKSRSMGPRQGPILAAVGNLAEHFVPHRQDERKAVIALHPADRDADEVALLIQDAAAGYARMAVGQARHQSVRHPLADVPGRQDDALRVVVAEAEDRLGEVVRERRIG